MQNAECRMQSSGDATGGGGLIVLGDGDGEGWGNVGGWELFGEVAIVGGEKMKVALQEDVAAEGRFDGGLLRVGTGDGDSALPVADELDRFEQVDAGGGQLA